MLKCWFGQQKGPSLGCFLKKELRLDYQNCITSFPVLACPVTSSFSVLNPILGRERRDPNANFCREFIIKQPKHLSFSSTGGQLCPVISSNYWPSTGRLMKDYPFPQLRGTFQSNLQLVQFIEHSGRAGLRVSHDRHKQPFFDAPPTPFSPRPKQYTDGFRTVCCELQCIWPLNLPNVQESEQRGELKCSTGTSCFSNSRLFFGGGGEAEREREREGFFKESKTGG